MQGVILPPVEGRRVRRNGKEVDLVTRDCCVSTIVCRDSHRGDVECGVVIGVEGRVPRECEHRFARSDCESSGSHGLAVVARG